MATNYPTSIDSFTNPTSGDTLDSPSHAAQHANINDAMVAVQTKLGVGSGTIGTWTAYTPTFTNLTVGNGTVDFKYSQINKVVVLRGRFTFGTTSSISGLVYFTLPVTMPTNSVGVSSYVRFLDAGVAGYSGGLEPSSTTQVFLTVHNAAGTYVVQGATSATAPFHWGNGDLFDFHAVYEAA